MTKENFVLSGTIAFKEALPNHEYKIGGEAGHGGLTTYHKGEVFDKRKYIAEQYQKAIEEASARIASGEIIPVYLDHETPFPNSRLTKLFWNDKKNAVCYEAIIPEAAARMIEGGQITGCSLNCNPWVKGGGVAWADGFAPFGFVFEELSLTDQRMDPGDPQASVRFLEGLEKTFELDPEHVEKINRKKQQLERQVPDQAETETPLEHFRKKITRR